jgi:glucokinase
MSANKQEIYLGIDLGGSKILTAVVDDRGEILSRDYRVTPANDGPDAVVREVLKSATSALVPLGIAMQELAAIGIGAPGTSNPGRGVVFTSPNLPEWHNVPLRDIVVRETGRKSYLINDANAAALGELYFGVARGVRHMIYVTISTGIGGGIIIDGQLYTGSVGTAGEIGHMTIDANGPRCRCGNTGCWEVLASGTALADRARQQIRGGAKTSILDDAGGDLEKVTAPVIQAAAERGDPLARELIAKTGYYLGVGLANLINIFNPELIVIGGGLSNIGEALLSPAFQVAGERAFKEAYQAVRFALPELGADSGVLGAAAFARQSVSGEDQ